jgi:hypothetical protein
MKTTELNYTQAYEAMEKGEKIKLPEWTGYWYMEGSIIKVCTRKGEILETPYIADYKTRTDWTICDGSRDFGGALTALKAGKKVARKEWNGKGMFIFLRPADEISVTTIVHEVKSLPQSVKNFFAQKTNPSIENRIDGNDKIRFCDYLCMYAADGSIVNGWLASQTDMLAEDWNIVE